MMWIETTGLKEAMEALRRFGTKLEAAAAEAVEAEAREVMERAKRRCPVATGALRDSHRVEVERTRDGVSARVIAGGPGAPYAYYVHENLEAAHHDGGDAKWLETSLYEAKPRFASNVAARIDRRLK